MSVSKPTDAKRTTRILWAIDAFDDLPEVQRNELNILRTFGKRSGVVIEPAYVLSPVELGISLDLNPAWVEAYVPLVKKALVQRIKGADLPGLGEPHVLVQTGVSLKKSVRTLAEFADARSFDLIVVGSHGRKGLERVMLGSFAEELLLQSQVPVLVVGRQSGVWPEKTGEEIRILLPNDFSDPQSGFFEEAFAFARALGAKVTLLNSIPRPIEQVFQAGVFLLGGGWVPAPVYLEKQRTQQEARASEILAMARERGVSVDTVVDDTSPSVTESVLRHARERKTQFVAMAAESGPVASALLGSITRQIVRSAPCPVWVFRSRRSS